MYLKLHLICANGRMLNCKGVHLVMQKIRLFHIKGRQGGVDCTYFILWKTITLVHFSKTKIHSPLFVRSKIGILYMNCSTFFDDLNRQINIHQDFKVQWQNHNFYNVFQFILEISRHDYHTFAIMCVCVYFECTYFKHSTRWHQLINKTEICKNSFFSKRKYIELIY